MDANPLQVTTLPLPSPHPSPIILTAFHHCLPSLTVFPFLSWVERVIVRGDCFAQMQTSQPGVQSANKRPTASLKQQKKQQQQ